MENIKSKGNFKPNNTKSKFDKRNTSISNSVTSMKSSQLMKLFEDELKDIFWAEKALTKAIPAMIKNATHIQLIETLSAYLEQTNVHLERLAKVFASIDKKPVAKKCEAMDGLIREAGEIMDACEIGAMCDAGIISAAQKVEHYQIASYGTLHQFAETLGLKDAVKLLAATLSEEKTADEKLSEVACNAINLEAAEIKA